MTKLINITPHTVKFVDAETGDELDIRQNRNIPTVRVAQDVETERYIRIKGIILPLKVYHTLPIQESQLPPVKERTLYIVSRLVADTYREQRPDFVFPTDFQRTEHGAIIGCKALARFKDVG